MPKINEIRYLRKEGYRILEIARKVGVDRKTVRKYLEVVIFDNATGVGRRIKDIDHRQNLSD